jgi:hypothetical protein
MKNYMMHGTRCTVHDHNDSSIMYSAPLEATECEKARSAETFVAVCVSARD